jgi:hypothetical protein
MVIEPRKRDWDETGLDLSDFGQYFLPAHMRTFDSVTRASGPSHEL